MIPLFFMVINRWQKDVVGMVEEKKREKSKVSVSFECETLKADTAADDHLTKFMPKLLGMDAIGKFLPLFSFLRVHFA